MLAEKISFKKIGNYFECSAFVDIWYCKTGENMEQTFDALIKELEEKFGKCVLDGFFDSYTTSFSGDSIMFVRCNDDFNGLSHWVDKNR